MYDEICAGLHEGRTLDPPADGQGDHPNWVRIESQGRGWAGGGGATAQKAIFWSGHHPISVWR